MRNYLEECKKTHNNKYDYSLSIFKGVHYKIKIICPIHGEFEQRLDIHLKGSSCKKCHINKIKFIKNENSNYIDECKSIHNNKYNYSLTEYTNMNDNIKIICPKHGVFEQKLYRHKKGSGCQKCFFDKLRLTIEDFIEKSKKIHGDKYDYSLVEYINHMTNVKIICSKHGVFEQTPNNHLTGDSCPKCSKNYQLSKDETINIANIKHNNKYDYSLTTFDNTHQKVKIICPIHGIFEQNIYQHININGCPKCNKKIMNTEHFISLSRDIHNDKYNYNKSVFIAMKD
jgi:Zn finger protein HypA/HybF involved in hydrogenase expression